MTLVASYVKDGNVFMLADSHGFGDSRVYPNMTKIFRRKVRYASGDPAGEMLLGYCGAASVGIIARQFEIPTITDPKDKDNFIDGITLAMQRFATDLPFNMNAEAMDQAWLIAYAGTVWLTNAFDPVECAPFGATGAGDDMALGAFEALERSEGPAHNPLERLEAVGDCVIAHTHKVRPPWQIETLLA